MFLMELISLGIYLSKTYKYFPQNSDREKIEHKNRSPIDSCYSMWSTLY